MKIRPFIHSILFATAAATSNTGQCGEDVHSPQKAVRDVSERFGFRLSEVARKTIEIITNPITTQSPWTVKETSVVQHQDKIGVYRLRDGWFKLIDAEVIQKNSAGWVIRTSELKVGDELVVHGTALLRVTDLQAFSAGE